MSMSSRPATRRPRPTRAVKAIRDLGKANGFGVQSNGDPAIVHRGEPRPVPGRRLPDRARQPPQRRPGGRLRGVLPCRRRLCRHRHGRRVRARVGLPDRGHRRTRSTSRTAAQPGTIKVADRIHDASKDLPETWDRTEAWYNFDPNVRGFSHVLATVVEEPFARQPSGDGSRGHQRRHDGLRPPGRLVQGLPGRPFVLHRARRQLGIVRRRRLSVAHPGRDRVGRGRVRPGLLATAARRSSPTTSRPRSARRRTCPSRSASTSCLTAASSRPTAAVACGCTIPRRTRPRCSPRSPSTPTARTACTARRSTTTSRTTTGSTCSTPRRRSRTSGWRTGRSSPRRRRP